MDAISNSGPVEKFDAVVVKYSNNKNGSAIVHVCLNYNFYYLTSLAISTSFNDTFMLCRVVIKFLSFAKSVLILQKLLFLC